MSAPGRHTGYRQQQGVALIMVLWLLVLLTIIASSHAHNIRIETQLARSQLDLSRARALAEAGIYRAVMGLLAATETDIWPVNGSPVEFELDDARLSIRIRDGRGLIDLNTAQSSVLEKVLAAVDVEEARSQALASAILDWRDQDSLKHLNGAEATDYRLEGIDWGPRNGPFTSVEELGYVLGMNAGIFKRLAPYLTVHSGHQGVDLEVAPPWLATTLSGEGIDRTDSSTPPAGRDTNRTGVFHISVWSMVPSGALASLDVVIRISNDQEQPYVILSWREPARSLVSSAAPDPA